MKNDKFIISVKTESQKRLYFRLNSSLYLNHEVTTELAKKKDYSTLKEMITIAMLGYEIKDMPEYHITSEFHLDGDLKTSNVPRGHIIQLPRVPKDQHDLDKKLHRILIFLNKDIPEELFEKEIRNE